MKHRLMLFFAFCWAATAWGQAPLASFTFDSQSQADTWLDIPNNSWFFTADGTAESLDPTLWNGRPPIGSDSGGGALAIGQGFDRAASPAINLSGHNTVYLKFNQYYRHLQAILFVTVTNLSTGSAQSFNINQGLQPQVETSPNDVQVIDITTIAANSNIQLEFVYEGNGYFWIIDDVELHAFFPYPETNPIHYGDTLAALGYPFQTDSLDWPYFTREVVAQFVPGTPDTTKIRLRNQYGAVLKDSCVCNQLELWTLGDSLAFDANGNPVPNGPSIGILERVKGATAEVPLQGVDPNYVTISQLLDQAPAENMPLTDQDLNGIPPAPADAVRIAVIDTGVDYQHEGLGGYIFRKPDELNEGDDDDNCYPDDPIGVDFSTTLLPRNNPMDNHGHGTHVVGIIARTLDTASCAGCNFHILPYKSHDSRGVSSLFQVACATYQALEDGAQVINDSWGFYGSSSTILRNAVDDAAAQQTLIVSAAGNDSLNLDTLALYPACFDAPNQIAVGAWEWMPEGETDSVCTRSIFSNFSPGLVDIAAPGRDIDSYLPMGMTGLKSGTSMSTPQVAAAAALIYCTMGPAADAQAVRDIILDNAMPVSALAPFAANGRKLDVPQICLVGQQETDVPGLQLRAYPNPAQAMVYLEAGPAKEAGEIFLFDAFGRVVARSLLLPGNATTTEQFDLSGLPAGLYVLSVQLPGQRWSARIIKTQ